MIAEDGSSDNPSSKARWSGDSVERPEACDSPQVRQPTAYLS
jgi:hypothetical protein